MTGTVAGRPLNEALSAAVVFSLPASRLDQPEESYRSRPISDRPSETVHIPVEDLRPLLSSEESPREQLSRLGYAVAKHRSKHLANLQTEAGAQAYADETCNEIIKELLGCDRVFYWNTLIRRNDPEVVEKALGKQTPAELKDAPLDTRKPLGRAHVDQAAEMGPRLCREMLDQSIEEVKRFMIVNVWRPLRGPVTNAPLFVCAYSTVNHDEDVSVHSHDGGTAYNIHYSDKQKWGYIRHQSPAEVYLLKNYDSAQGRNGDALFSAHSSGGIGEQDKEQGKDMLPRESVEVRCMAVWD